MNRVFLNFLKVKIKRKLYLKNELKKKILKSIIQNQSVNPLKKQYAYYNLIKMSVLSYKIKNTCLLNGRNSAVSNNFFLSRHALKKLLSVNKLQNVKIRSW
jgi:ribosomal protein S14